jgi:hypothetical protein
MTQNTSNVLCSILTWKNLNDKKIARTILNRIKQEGSVYEFDRMGYEEPLEVRFDTERAVEMWCTNSSLRKDLVYCHLFMKKTGYPHTLMSVSWQEHPKGLMLNNLGFTFNHRFMNSSDDVEGVLGLVSEFLVLIECGYGKIFSISEVEKKDMVSQRLTSGATVERTVPLSPREGLKGIYWANFFGPPYVQLFGREKIESCPAYQVQDIGGGSYLLLMSEFASEWSKRSVLKLSEQAKRHLNSGAFLDKKHPDKKPIPPDWPHEVKAHEGK